jgi:hypothetical protein
MVADFKVHPGKTKFTSNRMEAVSSIGAIFSGFLALHQNSLPISPQFKTLI